MRRLRGKLARDRRHRRTTWAHELVTRHDTVCVEKLATGNMTRGARGTSETPGTNVASKQGLNRKLLGIAPAEQTALLLRAGAGHGTRIELVDPRGTSRTCNACGYRHRKNRESQATFRCRRCGHTDNADANAARNLRDRGIATLRARVHASRTGAPAPARRNRRKAADRTPGALSTLRKPAPPERAPATGRPRFQHSDRTATTTHDSWPDRETHESRPSGQIS